MYKIEVAHETEAIRILEVPAITATCVLRALDVRIDMAVVSAPSLIEANAAAEAIGMEVLNEAQYASDRDRARTRLSGVLARSGDGRTRDYVLGNLVREKFGFSAYKAEDPVESEQEVSALAHLQQLGGDNRLNVDALFPALEFADEVLEAYLAGKSR